MKKRTASIERTLVKKALVTTAVYVGVYYASKYATKALIAEAQKNH